MAPGPYTTTFVICPLYATMGSLEAKTFGNTTYYCYVEMRWIDGRSRRARTV